MSLPQPSSPSFPLLQKMRIFISKSLKVQKWLLKLTRCGRGRTGRFGLAVLVTGTLFCLLLPAFTPRPSPAEPHRPLRRIHQQEDTGPKSMLGKGKQGRGKQPDSLVAPIPKSLANVIGLTLTSHKSVNNQSAAALKSQSEGTAATAWDAKKIFPKLAQVPEHTIRDKITLARAQEGAINAMNFGYKLTQAQKKIVEELTPRAKKELEARIAKTRLAQDRVYLSHLRARKQIVARAGGGEQVVSMANRTVRFPVMLKKAPIKDWPVQYKIYQNLTHYPWVRSKGCERFSITFTPPGSLPPRGLASFPSSGNTWVRYLIEGASGIFTGSLYDDTSLMTKGMYGEGLVYDSGMTILQKSHGFTTGEAMTMEDRRNRSQHNHLQELGYRGVVVIRNPFKALISHRNLDVGGHTGYAPRAHFLGQGWTDFVTLKVRLWSDFYEDWVRRTAPQDTYVTHYELIRDDPVQEMRGILTYLKIPLDESRLTCLGRNLDGLFKRKPKRNLQLDFDPFTEELRGVIYEAIDAVDVALRERGKDGLPLGKYEIYDAEEVEVLKERRRDGNAMKVFGGV